VLRARPCVLSAHFEELWAPSSWYTRILSQQTASDKGLRIYYEPSIKVLHHFRASMPQHLWTEKLGTLRAMRTQNTDNT